MTQESLHHDYKYSALKQTAHVPFHVLEWPVLASQEKCYQIFIWLIFTLKYLEGWGFFIKT